MLGPIRSILFLVTGPLIAVTALLKVNDGSVTPRKKAGVAVLFLVIGLYVFDFRILLPVACSGPVVCWFQNVLYGLFNAAIAVCLALLGAFAGAFVPDPAQIDQGASFLPAGAVVLAGLLMAIYAVGITSPALHLSQTEITRRCGGSVLCRLQLTGGQLLLGAGILVAVLLGPLVVGMVVFIVRGHN